MMRSWITMAVLAALAMAPRAAAGQGVPTTVTFTARILDGDAPATGPHELVFRLYAQATGGAALWEESASVDLEDGLVFHELGSQEPLDAALLDGSKLFLELVVDGTALSPRVAIVSVPYAVRAGVAGDAETLGGLGATDFAPSAHTHSGTYLPVGTNLSCGPGTFVTALSGTTGDLTCAAPSSVTDVMWTSLSGYPAACAAGQAIVGLNDTPTCAAFDATGDTIADDGMITDAELSDTVTIGSGGSVTWSALASYPAACAAGSAITTLGDAPTCAAFDATGDTIADDGVISDAEASDALSIASGSLTAPNVAGNVGIGIATPTAALHIARTANITETCAAGILEANVSGLKFRDDPGGGCGDTAYLAYVDLDGAGAGEATRLLIVNGNDADDDIALRNSAGRFHFGNATAFTGQLNVGNTGGRAGAAGFDPPTSSGATEVGVWLEGGSIEAGGFYADGDVAMVYSPGDPDLFRIYDEDGMVLRAYFDGVGNLRVANGNTTGCVQDGDGTAIAGTCASDRRFKKDIRPFASLLDRVMRLQPVHYRWRADEFPAQRFGTAETYGLIAQDVAEVFPEMVAQSPDGYLAVDYSRLPLVLLQALKEEHARVGALEGEVNTLREQNVLLERRLARLEAQIAPVAPKGASRGTDRGLVLAAGGGGALVLLLGYLVRRRAR